jgi:hypothetical protein
MRKSNLYYYKPLTHRSLTITQFQIAAIHMSSIVFADIEVIHIDRVLNQRLFDILTKAEPKVIVLSEAIAICNSHI